MSKIKCILVDDEPLAAQLLESYIKKTPFLDLVGTFNSPSAAKEKLNTEEIDLIFLDIQMPDINGIDFSSGIKPQTRIIFTTAFSEYALNGYKVNALDYLLKPFNYDEFLKAAVKAKDWFDLVNKQKAPESEQILFVKSGYNNVQIKLSEVTYFQGFKDYIKIYTDNSKSPVLTLMTMKALMQSLPKDMFIRVHRSYIIPVNKIKSSDKSSVWVGEHKIPVSDSYKESFATFISTRSFKTT